MDDCPFTVRPELVEGPRFLLALRLKEKLRFDNPGSRPGQGNA